MRSARLAPLATLGLTLLAVPMAVDSQPMPKVPRVGYLCAVACGEIGGQLPLFTQALETFGYVNGRNIRIEYLGPDQGEPTQLGRLAQELVRRQADVIFVAGETTAALAARNATSTIPIVIAVSGDPVGLGLAKSLARPGGNITGVTYLREQVTTKGLELLKQAVPSVS